MSKYLIPTLFFLCFNFSLFGQTAFKVNIDTRFEAISLFYILTTADTLDVKPTPSTYYRDVKKYFASCKLHPSLEWYRKLDKWDGFDVASLGIYLSAYPFQVSRKVETNYVKSAALDTFLYHLNKFYNECNVKDFLRNNQSEYQRIVTHAQDTILKSKILEDVSHFFGHPQKGEFVIYLDLLNNLGSNAIPITDSEFKGKRISRIAFLSDTSSHLTDQDPVTFNPKLNVVAHESSHNFVGDFIPKYEQRLYAIRNLFLTTTSGKVLKESEWKNELDELLIRVCVAKILEKRDGEAAGMAEIANQAKHFRLAQPLYKFFNKYVEGRNRYKKIEQFYPELIAYLEKLAVTQ